MLDLTTLGRFILRTLKEESQLLANYPSNWDNVYGLPGRREAHVVYSVARAMHARKIRCILEDDFWECPNSRCDLAARLGDTENDWVWVEFKTMPMEDATDKLASVHFDIQKLDRAAKADPRNRKQALVVVGFESVERELEDRFLKVASAHGLTKWPFRLGQLGATTFDLPSAPEGARPSHYVRCVVGYWARPDRYARTLDCDGRCHSKRTLLARPVTAEEA